MHKIARVIMIASVFSTPALADDAIEGAPSSNIVFESAPELIMQDETLTISKSSGKVLGSERFSIDVDFHFKNTSDHDVTRKIAFVLPPVQCREDAASMWRGLDSDERVDQHMKGLQDFTTLVDGKNQSYTVRTESILGKRNITSLLTELHLPLNPCDIKMGNDGQPDKAYGDALVKHHLLTMTNDPAWKQNIYFEWTQTFPAGKTIHISHHYTPVVGEAVMAKRTAQDINQFLSDGQAKAKAIWSSPLSSIENKGGYCAMPMWVRYHLSTGAYWKGGIGLFKLILKDEDGAPFAINPFYKSTDKAKKTISKNSMIFEVSNFVPKENLHILYLSLPHNEEEKKLCGD